MFLDIEYVIAVCECIIHFNEGYPFDKKYIDEVLCVGDAKPTYKLG